MLRTGLICAATLFLAKEFFVLNYELIIIATFFCLLISLVKASSNLLNNSFDNHTKNISKNISTNFEDDIIVLELNKGNIAKKLITNILLFTFNPEKNHLVLNESTKITELLNIAILQLQ
jgi:Mitochondrial ATP synthase B chain precursor (ATP-synt_B)